MYGSNPTNVLYLVPIKKPKRVSGDADAMAHGIKAMHEEVQKRLKASNRKYQVDADRSRRQQEFEEGDLIWVFLHKERFFVGTYNKLKERKIGPCKINRRIGYNAYHVQFPSHVQATTIFNVAI